MVDSGRPVATKTYPAHATLAVMLFSVAVFGQAPVAGPPIFVTGEVSVIQEDTPGGGTLRHFVTDFRTGRAYEIKFEDAPKRPLTSGQVIQLRGQARGDEFLVSSGDIPTLQVVQEVASVPGLRTIAVIIVNFLDASVSCSPADVAAKMFPNPAQGGANASVSGFYLESSFDQVGLEPDTDGDGFADVFGPYTVNARSSDACDYYGWAYEAEDLAAADGVELSLYRHLLFVIPSSNTCSWAGVANVGCGTQCRAWVARCQYLDLFAHELGHNLGMRHASTDANNDGVSDSEYGDYSDVMGYSGVGLRHPNAPHKAQMGWLNLDATTVRTISQSGTYAIAPIEIDPLAVSLPQVLKIAKPGTSDYYYLSYRLKLGYDTSLRSSYPDRLNIHRFSGSGATFLITTLADGGVFTDAANAITITQLAHNSDPITGSATVQVEFGVSSAPAPPTVSLAPSSQTTNGASTPVNYTLSMTNNDGAGSSPATFALAVTTLPSGWGGSFSPSTLTLAPGQSGTATLAVIPSSSSPDATYTVGATVSDGSGAHSPVARSVSCRLDKTAPTPVSDLRGSVIRKKQVELAWTASSDGTGSGVKEYLVYRALGTANLTLLAVTSGTQFRDANVARGKSYMYAVAVRDVAGNVSAFSNTVTLTIPSR